jgi:lipopolysaccharide export system protein LptA
MAESSHQKFQFRAKLPLVMRFAAIAVLGATVLAVLVGFYRQRNNTGFRLKPEHTQLSKDVVAEVSGYERVESDGDVKKYYVKADHARTFSDNHQELDNVYIEVYGDGGSVDKLSAQQALYVPEEQRNFTAYLKGDVAIETRDSLKVKTDNIVYTKKTDSADAEGEVAFERENIKGTSVGAVIYAAEKRLKLLRDVNVEMTESGNGLESALFRGGAALYDHGANKLEVTGKIDADLKSLNGARNTTVRSDRLVAMLVPKEGQQQPELRSLQLFDNVWIETTEHSARQSTIETSYAFYNPPADRFELKNGVHIVTGSDETSDIKSSEAVYEQSAGNVQLIGSAEISRGGAFIRGETLNAKLNQQRHLTAASVSGSSYLKNTAAERTTEIWANQMDAAFDDAQQVKNADASGNAKAVVTPTANESYTSFSIATPGALKAVFKPGGLPSVMNAQDRPTVQLNAPAGASDAANKRVIADNVSVAFYDNGKDIRRAEAVGNAELYIAPIQNAPQNYRTSIFAPRFDCEFYAGNNARECVGATGTRTVREPTVPAQNRGTQTLTSDKLTAAFNENTKDIDSLQAAGKAKFTELDRSAVASAMTFTQSDQVVRLRGGEPTFWDSNSRAKAEEIDWDTKNQRSFLRNGVSTTYYSRKRTGDAAPFGNSEKPVFATAQSMEVDHNTQTAVYSGNARAWQDNSYVRSDKFSIDQKNGSFFAEGSVQSLLYEARQRRKTSSGNVPVYASSATMSYSRNERLLKYRTNVDIRQGTDRMTAQAADIYLDNNNEMSRTVVENNVVITQPGRKAAGDWAEYTSENEVAVIRGNPARVDDSESGSSQAGQFTVYLRENRVLSDGAGKQNSSARTRSVYKVKTIQ